MNGYQIRTTGGAGRLGSLVIVLACTGIFALGAGAQTTRFEAPRIVTTLGDVTPQVVDVDGDGNEDVVFGSASDTRVFVALGDGAGGFLDPVGYDAGGQQTAIDVGDVDGDTNLDVVATLGAASKLAVLLGNGIGGFGPPQLTDTSSVPEHVHLGEFTGDAHLDVAIGDAAAGVTLFVGDGAGGFTPSTFIQQNPYLTGISSGDFDEDGNLDLVSIARSVVGVHFNDGGGGIAFSRFVAGYSELRAFAVADLDGDGHLDIAVGNSDPEGSEVGLLFGNGMSQFDVATLPHTGTSPIVAGDFDEDGILDLSISRTIWIGDGQRSFTRSANVDSNRSGRAATDVDDDGHLDLLVLTADALSYLRGDGNGNFRTTRGATDWASPLASADFDGDGFADVIGGKGTGVRIFTSDGVGGLRTGSATATGDGVVAIATADFDNDSAIDVAVAHGTSEDVVVLLGDGSGGFGSPVSFGAPTKPTDITTGDFDEDGFADIAVATSDTRAFPGRNSIEVWLGDGLGGFAHAFTHEEVRADPFFVRAVDVDVDGHLDLLAAYTGVFQGGSRPYVLALLGDGQGGFAPPLQQLAFRSDTRARAAAVGDFNEDGRPDVAVHCDSLFSPHIYWVSVVTSDGDGTFTDRQFPVDTRLDDVVALDADGDGHLDLAIQQDGEISVLRGDGAGNLDVATPDRMLTRGIVSDLIVTDLDGDGRTDLVNSGVIVGPIPNLTDGPTACRTSDVNRAAGSAVDVLLVDGSPGVGTERVVTVPIGATFEVRMDAPPATSPAVFALYATVGTPTHATLDRQPRHLGILCMPTPTTGRFPQPARVWNNTGVPFLGTPTHASTAAPSVVFQGAVPVGTTVFLQGLIRDAGAPNGFASRTNGIELHIE